MYLCRVLLLLLLSADITCLCFVRLLRCIDLSIMVPTVNADSQTPSWNLQPLIHTLLYAFLTFKEILQCVLTWYTSISFFLLQFVEKVYALTQMCFELFSHYFVSIYWVLLFIYKCHIYLTAKFYTTTL